MDTTGKCLQPDTWTFQTLCHLYHQKNKEVDFVCSHNQKKKKRKDSMSVASFQFSIEGGKGFDRPKWVKKQLATT